MARHTRPQPPRRSNRQAGPPGRRSRRLGVIAILAIVLLVIAFALARTPGLRRHPGGRPRAEGPPPNVLLITLDTTRADHLGVYGYQRARTQHIDRLAREGVRFQWAFSPAPLTLPAHASILTGLYPFTHGVRNNGNFYLSDRFETLATILKKQGYETAAFVSSFILDRRYGLARGFDTYDDRMEGADPRVVALEAERRGDRTALGLLRWLDQHATGAPVARGQSTTQAAPDRDRDPAAGTPTRPNVSQTAPFFVWLHLYDPHEPYHAPPPFGPAFADSPYDGEIAFDDAIVASVMDKLGQLGLRERTLVAIIGDHGESLGDHGEETHTMFVYDPAIRVPLILWQPGRLPGGKVIGDVVRATDLAPTILDLVGAPPLRSPDGRSLVPLIDCSSDRGCSGGPAPPVYAETLLPQLYMNWAPLRAIRDERWKLIQAPRPELYDLAADPGEQKNLYARRTQTARGLELQLERVTGGQSGGMSVGRMDRDALDRLAALGYVGAGAEPASIEGAARPDPKDMIATFNRLRAANSAVRDRRFADALPILREVLARDPRNAFAQLVLGSARMGMGDYRDAIAEYRRYLQLVPTSSYAHQWIAICCLRLGDRAGALREAEAALAIDPRFSDARVLRGGILAARGDYAAAIAELRAAVETDPAKPALRLDLAKVLSEAGDLPAAQREYEQALNVQADYGPALTGLGGVLARLGNYQAAENALARAIEIDPSDDQARFNLAQVYEREGRAPDALEEYRRLAGSGDPAVRAAATTRARELQAGR